MNVNDTAPDALDLMATDTNNPTDQTDPIRGLGIEVIELDIANDGPPVFDIMVTEPAIVKHVYAVVKRPEVKLIGGNNSGRLMPRLVCEVMYGAPKRPMRIALIAFGDVIPKEVALNAKYLGVFIHPMTTEPIAVYELPSPVQVDPLAALENTRVDISNIGAPMVEPPVVEPV